MTPVSPQHRPSSPKIPALEGLRGLAILLVVLSHIWVVYPFDRLGEIAPLDGWFKGGSIAVSIFLVLSGFLVTRSLLDAFDDRGASGVGYPLLRRFLRISAQVYLLLVAVLVAAQVDAKDTATEAATSKSTVAVATYTWNWYVREHALEARGDLGHLWYLSVELQVFIALAVAIALWGSRRRALVVGVVVLIVAVTWWRWRVYDVEGWYSASLRTTTRADAALWGILAALLWDRAQRWRREAPAVLGAATLVIVAVVFSGTRLGIDAYFKGQGIAVAIATALFVLAASMPESRTSPAARLLGAAPLRTLGAVSLTLYVWHLPVYWFVSRHTTSWSNLSRTIITVAVLVALVTVLHSFVDEPLRRWTGRIGRIGGPRPAVRTEA
ncbi:Peptidoglycan/LPS O-acetylase OafA/YrhL, contains acyltransferase and SGNH-hydrolase domains [Pedococcus dokdonensis]|uniref:Peptidoglycan/LPS O-acetylase OafA/YrhL, contains acyltransferase and SGNH-hydrolase domains n=1 Tax=Pedococcus dokdonensis TaxID=443156 RepID=A0A1H0PBP9_9MICO|nr:Peptidoglycan/LPS O-acetylase OafA/YrhL, contains acyltransferase and SGNH-hydrolase domains [Pedococcus dokdonensis]